MSCAGRGGSRWKRRLRHRSCPGVPGDKLAPPESRIMPGPGGFQPSGGGGPHQVIVAAGHQPAVGSPVRGDHRQRRCSPQGSIADAGYSRQRQSTSFRPVRRAGAAPRPGCSHPRPEVAYPAICLPGTGSAEVQTKPGSTLCGWRPGIRFRQFLMRGLEKVNSEWSLICTGPAQAGFGVNQHG